MVNIGVVGCGYWGVNYIRVFSELADTKLVIACDCSETRLRIVRDRYPLVTTTAEWREVLENRWVDAVVLATPASAHYEVAKAALLAGKHVLAEKPLTTEVAHAEELTQLAAERGLVLLVGHTFLYNSGIRKLKQLMQGADFGRTYYLHATRTNMGPVRKDVNALWDLGAHDIAIFNYLLEASPLRVSAVGGYLLAGKYADVVFATFHYPQDVIANIHVSWADPNKVRAVVAVGSHRRIVFDDLNNLERVRIFEKGLEPSLEADSYGEYRLLVRDGDIISPRVEPSEPLKNQAAEFLECIRSGKQPLSDGRLGVEVVRVLCAADRSIAAHGAPVDLASAAAAQGAGR